MVASSSSFPSAVVASLERSVVPASTSAWPASPTPTGRSQHATHTTLAPSAQSLLECGGVVTAYMVESLSGQSSDRARSGSSGLGGYFTCLVSLFVDREAQSLYWSEPTRREQRASRAIPLARVTSLLVGKHSSVLRHSAISADPERCVTITWTDDDTGSNESLDFECESESQRTDWLAVVDHLLSACGRVLLESPSEVHELREADGPIDPLCIGSRRPRDPDTRPVSRSITAISSMRTSTRIYPPPLPLPLATPLASSDLPSMPSLCFPGAASVIDLDFSDRKSKRFIVFDRSALKDHQGAGDVAAAAAAATLTSTLAQFTSWLGVAPARPPFSPIPHMHNTASPPRTRAASRRHMRSVTTMIAPKDDPNSLEGSLARLGAGVPFVYCPPVPPDDTSAASAADTAAVILPGQTPPVRPVPGQQTTFSEPVNSILMFYTPPSRRGPGRHATLGQVSWCSSHTWSRDSSWRRTIHVDTTIILGKGTMNFEREAYAGLPSDHCFSIVHGDDSIDLFCEQGWIGIRAWLNALDRVLHSIGFAMVHQGRLADGGGLPLGLASVGVGPVRVVLVSQSDLKRQMAYESSQSRGAFDAAAMSASEESTRRTGRRPQLRKADSLSSLAAPLSRPVTSVKRELRVTVPATPDAASAAAAAAAPQSTNAQVRSVSPISLVGLGVAAATGPGASGPKSTSRAHRRYRSVGAMPPLDRIVRGIDRSHSRSPSGKRGTLGLSHVRGQRTTFNYPFVFDTSPAGNITLLAPTATPPLPAQAAATILAKDDALMTRLAGASATNSTLRASLRTSESHLNSAATSPLARGAPVTSTCTTTAPSNRSSGGPLTPLFAAFGGSPLDVDASVSATLLPSLSSMPTSPATETRIAITNAPESM